MRLHHPATRAENDQIKGWVNERLPEQDDFNGAYAVAVTDEDDCIVAGVIFSNHSGSNVFMSGAIEKNGKVRVTREKLSDMLAIAFDNPMNCLRITALVSPTNKRSQRFMQGLGFTHEGTFRDYMGRDTETLIYGLTRTDFEGGDYGRREQAT